MPSNYEFWISRGGSHVLGSRQLLTTNRDLEDIHQSVETIVFAVDHRTLSKTGIEGISLFHYRELGHEESIRAHLDVDYAEILVHYGKDPEEQNDVTSNEIRCALSARGRFDD